MDLLKLWQRGGGGPEDDPQTEINPDEHGGEQLESDLQLLILEQLARGGISHDCVAVEVRAFGHGSDGRLVHAGMLRLTRWDERSAVRLLLGLPLLQAKVRRALRGSWMYDVSHFAGLWLHPSGQFEESGAMSGLRHLILRIEDMQPYVRDAEGEHSVWSLPGELGQQGEPK